MRRTITALTVLLALTAAACSGATVATVPAATGTTPQTAPDPTGAGWTRLPDPPLDPRTLATVVWTGTDVIVTGGWEFECGPGADCAVPGDVTFTDGAAFDPVTETWRPIADAPTPFTGSPGAVVDGAVYILTTNCRHTDCDPTIGLLRYRPDANVWDAYPPPPVDGYYAVAGTSTTVMAYSRSDEGGEIPDWRFDLATGQWSAVPNDPLPPSFDREIVTDGDDLLLFASPIAWDGDGARPISAARYDAVDGEWKRLAPTGASGYGAWIVDGIVVINPHFRNASGGSYDIDQNAWATLPSAPPDDDWDKDLAGVIGGDDAVFSAPRGWVLDLTRAEWIQISPLDARVEFPTSTGITNVGRALFLFGGERWTDEGAGGLLGDAWMWRPPQPAS